jgi:N-sulfoglucosamine sulfohydrolase
MPDQPHILWMHAHDCGRAIQPYGWPVATPHLQRFARDGILFRHAFSAAPTCGPSRAAMMTGAYPHQCGMYGLPGAQGWALHDPAHHLVHTLNAAGYVTALAGVQHEVDHADLSPLGYQRWLDTREQKGEYYPETLDRVEAFLAESHTQPFFLSVGFDEPHRNNIARPDIGIGNESARFSKTRYYDPDKLDGRYTAPPPWLPDTPVIRRDTESLHEGIRILDDYVGRLLHMIHHRGLTHSTLVILTTDHGVEFSGAKKTLRDQGTGVFLMIRGPGGFEGGRVIEALVSHLDLYPTVLEMLGIAPKPWLQGHSLLPLIRGEKHAVREALFTEQTYHGSLEALRAIRTERYKFILRHDPVAPRMRHDGPTGPYMESLGAYDRPIGHEELFDLYLDPMEAHNLASSPAHTDIRRDLRTRLETWMRETNDPFLNGTLPLPPRG